MQHSYSDSSLPSNAHAPLTSSSTPLTMNQTSDHYPPPGGSTHNVWGVEPYFRGPASYIPHFPDQPLPSSVLATPTHTYPATAMPSGMSDHPTTSYIIPEQHTYLPHHAASYVETAVMAPPPAPPPALPALTASEQGKSSSENIRRSFFRSMADEIGFQPTEPGDITSHDKKRHYLECLEQYIIWLHEQITLRGMVPPPIQRLETYNGLNSRSIRTALVHMQNTTKRLYAEVIAHEEQYFAMERRLFPQASHTDATSHLTPPPPPPPHYGNMSMRGN